ncbi:ATP synthase subunit b [Sulfitobacter noctilucicola]|uniref:ATP synthase subunit b n=1 Tax=Sulfitobacter noctilucicola TaxID=1342301 RepID=A0A7W6M675_9RHOB|nr:F0F1 ATP synthase subunit B [Sulfitobacter noctilucicola]KIN62337.1 ATP synthase subunit b [Sulfitobacter noctilucicola]MBB4173129.1 F-type H+-transporting ATPase subunit b [Sulfitobacter noctilucicola]
MRFTLTVALTGLFATPALAAKGPFFSLTNTDFVVLLGLLVFIGILFYFKVPGLLGGMLDKRADDIRAELEEARRLREEAQTLLASYERKQKEVQEQADRIVSSAKEEANAAAEKAKLDLEKSVTRRMAAAAEQIGSAEASAIKEVRDQAASIAIAAARDVIAKQMTAAQGGQLIDDAIAQVETKLH